MLVGVGALLGGSMFVCTVVVGCIALLCPCEEVQARLFVRDISFHLLAVCAVCGTGVLRDITVPCAGSLIIAYVAYVCVVLGTSYCCAAPPSTTAVLREAGSTSSGVQLQTAFWHRGPAPRNVIIEQDYTFAFDTPSGARSRQGDEEAAGQEGEGVVNLSGGALLGDDVILEHYIGGAAEAAVSEEVEQGGAVLSSDLNEHLLGGGRGRGRGRGRQQSTSSGALAALYWQQWALRRRWTNRRYPPEGWDTMSAPRRLYYLLGEYAMIIARDLTIPSLSEATYSKPAALAHPLGCALLVLVLFRPSLRAALLLLMGSAAGTLAVHLLLGSQPPKGGALATAWMAAGFVMCVLWVYLLAGELITLLSLLGLLLALPPAFLGLTVLAWGNSVGDFFTNIAVAREGYGAMALAGCYAGPVFNILVGYGTSLLYAASMAYPAPYEVRLDASSKLTLLFLLLALSSTLAIVVLNGYQINRGLGVYLLTVYAVYSAAQGLLVALR